MGKNMVWRLFVLCDAIAIFCQCNPIKSSQEKVANRARGVEILEKQKEAEITFQKQFPWMRERRIRQRRIILQSDINDPQWKSQWYLNRGDGRDLNVIAAWRKGYTGKGIVVAVVDNGVNGTNPDLKQNFDVGVDFDAMYNRLNVINLGKYGHGTMCAGVIAAAANNNFCGVGIAYDATVGGVRTYSLKYKPNDTVEARAFKFRRNYIDIYSSSWGPLDYYDVLGGPGVLTQKEMKKGVEQGRDGRGSIYVFSGGNGGGTTYYDNCAYNGYVNSVYTIGINSVNVNDNVPKYAERCSAILASTYSRDHENRMVSNGTIVTTGFGTEECTDTFSGTSASAAMASGIIALALQANAKLTWRDVQHLIVRTSRPHIPKSKDWKVNGASLRVSNYFGFGLMDAGRMVERAEKWIQVPQQINCTLQHLQTNRPIPSRRFLNLNTEDSSCDGMENSIKFLEHVQLIVSFTFRARGSLEILLTSPSGTISEVLPTRKFDYKKDLTNWALLSVHFWGEDARGVWKISMRNTHAAEITGTLYNWTLILYGTSSNPLKHAPSTPSSPLCTTTAKHAGNVPATSKPKGLTTGHLAGTVVGALLLVVFIVIICYLNYRYNYWPCCFLCWLYWYSSLCHAIFGNRTGAPQDVAPSGETQRTTADHWV